MERRPLFYIVNHVREVTIYVIPIMISKKQRILAAERALQKGRTSSYDPNKYLLSLVYLTFVYL